MNYSIPIPDDWDDQSNDYALVLLCVPNSVLWKGIVRGAIYDLTRGRSWDETTGTITDVQAIAKQIYRSMCMASCDDILAALNNIVTNQADTQKLLRLSIAAITGGTVNFDTDPVVPNSADYSATGLAPKFRTSNWIAADENIADILANSLFGNFPNIPNPLNGTGLADIVDDQMDVANPLLDLLQQHTTMADSSIFNPVGGEKNLVEVLETTLRTTSLGDLEPFPNVVDVLQSSLKLVNDDTWSKIWLYLEKKMGINIPWAHDIPAENTIAEILAGILGALMTGNGASMSRIAQAIQELEMQVNLNNYNGCCGEDDCNCGNCAETTITVPQNGTNGDMTYDFLGCGGDVVDG